MCAGVAESFSHFQPPLWEQGRLELGGGGGCRRSRPAYDAREVLPHESCAPGPKVPPRPSPSQPPPWSRQLHPRPSPSRALFRTQPPLHPPASPPPSCLPLGKSSQTLIYETCPLRAPDPPFPRGIRLSARLSVRHTWPQVWLTTGCPPAAKVTPSTWLLVPSGTT